MKKTLTLLSLITLISFYAKAQEPKDYVKSYLSLIAGVSSPLGDFAQTNYSNNKAGFAKKGAVAGFDAGIYVYKNLGIGVTFTFQDQGELTTPDAQILADGYNAYNKENTTLVQAVNRYHSLNLLIGPQYSFTYGKFILDIRANAGIVKSTSTPQLLIYLDNSSSAEKTITQSSSKSGVFGYGGAAGLRWAFADGWDLGLKVNYVDSQGLKINTTGDIGTGIGRLVTKQPVSELQTTLGIGVHF
jgi:hypothetical protein